ncbi:MAG: ABC transporter permease [Bacteroidota bacterium]
MLRSFLTIAIRNLKRQSFYALINIAGLAIGITCCVLIVLFVNDELSYDQYHRKSDRIYRLYTEIKLGEMDGKFSYMPAPMAKTLLQDFPEVEMAARMRGTGSYLVKRGNADNIKEEDVILADPEIFEIFDFDVIAGDPVAGLKAPNTLVLNQTLANKYFPDEDPIGQTLTINEQQDFKVVAVIADMPYNSHFRFDLFSTMENSEESKQQFWLSHNFFTYVVLREGTKADYLREKFPQMIEKYSGPELKQYLGVSIEEFKEGGSTLGYHVQSLKDVHLRAADIEGLGGNGDITYVYIFAIIAFFILLIACINFMNLSTARSATRAREVGIRKVLGSYRSHLVSQFLLESVILSVLSFLIAVGLLAGLLPYFNQLSGKHLNLDQLFTNIIPIMFLASVLVGILAGLYPAFFLSAFEPIQVLKGKYFAKSGKLNLRSFLVVFQFFASILLIIGTIVVQQQLSYIQNKKLGYNKEQVLIINDARTLGTQKTYTLKNEMKRIPNVREVSVSGYFPVDGFGENNNIYWPEGNRTQENSISMNSWRIDHDYLKTLGMNILQGRAFSLDFPTDSMAIILNEEAMKQFGYAEDPIGRKVISIDDIDPETGDATYEEYTVIGIVEDFHFNSVKNKIGAMALFLGGRGHLALKVSTGDIDQTLQSIGQTWNQFAPSQPFQYTFLDEHFDDMYDNEQQLGKIFGSFALLAILVACLGLFALATFMAEQRAKEISIRKVLGASTSQIVLLLSREFTRLVLIAFLLAIPVSWYVMQQWLDGFAYKVSMGVGTFLLAGTIAILIAFLTVSYQAIKAAFVDPIDALRNE